MATQKEARVVAVEDLSPLARLVTLAPTEPLEFVGGQYVIINSEVLLPDGKLAKRAYSILSPDTRRDELVLAVRRIGEGAASSFLHRVRRGDVVPFSGAWGKYLPDDARPRRATLILATDTGITAAMGLAQARSFAPQLATARIAWLVESEAYFLREDFVRARLSASLAQSQSPSLPLLRAPIPPVRHPERLAVAQAELERLLADGVPESVFLSGDGDVLFPLRDRLVAAGVSDGAIRLECFFNNPGKKSA